MQRRLILATLEGNPSKLADKIHDVQEVASKALEDWATLQHIANRYYLDTNPALRQAGEGILLTIVSRIESILKD